MYKLLLISLLTLNALMLGARPVVAAPIDPQYIFVRKNPMQCNPADCSQLWNMNNPGLDYYQGIKDIFEKIGTNGSNNRKLGIGILVYYNEYDFNNVKNSLQNLLIFAQAHTVPLLISLDGYQWWDMRPDLWNWWDPNLSGYNTDNVNNVEWTCNNSSCATNKSWRNWGQLIAIKPQANLASRKYIDDTKDRLKILIPLIVNWYNQLPDDKKWLLGGVTLGTELNIDYGDGTPIGFAAIRSLGLNGGITQNNLDQVIEKYLDELNLYAINLGIPRNKIFNHASTLHLMAGVTGSGYPGWSLYNEAAVNPSTVPGLDDALNQTNSIWSVPEWLTYASDYDGWLAALRNTLDYRNNRFLNVANWEGIRNTQYAVDAINTALSEQPSCWVTSPFNNSVTITGKSADISWQKGENNNAVYLNISNTNTFNDNGLFQNVNIANSDVTNSTSFHLSNLNAGKYYYLLAADGCDPVQRKISYGSFTVSGTLLGDINNNGKVDLFDYSLLVQNMGRTRTQGFIPVGVDPDIVKNDKVDIFDYGVLVQNFGKSN